MAHVQSIVLCACVSACLSFSVCLCVPLKLLGVGIVSIGSACVRAAQSLWLLRAASLSRGIYAQAQYKVSYTHSTHTQAHTQHTRTHTKSSVMFEPRQDVTRTDGQATAVVDLASC